MKKDGVKTSLFSPNGNGYLEQGLGRPNQYGSKQTPRTKIAGRMHNILKEFPLKCYRTRNILE